MPKEVEKFIDLSSRFVMPLGMLVAIVWGIITITNDRAHALHRLTIVERAVEEIQQDIQVNRGLNQRQVELLEQLLKK